MLGEGAGIDVLDAGNAVAREVIGETFPGAPIGGDFTEFADNEGADVRAGGFLVLRVDPVVADHGVGHGYDLAAVRGVRDHFLVTCHGGVETDFSGGGSAGSEGNSWKAASVFKG